MKASIILNDNRIALFACVLILLGCAGCSDDEVSPSGDNHPPGVVFAVAARAVPRSTRATLTVDVTDSDEDPVTVLWEVRRDGQPSGVLNPTQQGLPSIQWDTPAATGRDTITVTVSDGKAVTTLEETIQVGTLKRTRIQTASETWSATDSPFIIRPFEDSFVVDERMTLTVEAGSELLIDRGGLTINIVGKLTINGTAQAPVVIRPNTRTTEPGDWQGITANPSGAPPVLRLSHAHVMYATDAVKGNTSAEVFLDGCRITRSKESAVLHESFGELRVENSIITNNLNSGIKIRRFAEPTRMIVISGDSIAANGDQTGKTVYVDQAAIYIYMPDEDGSSDITISENIIWLNGVPGIHLVNSCYPKINRNTIFANERGKTGTSYNIKLEKDFGGIFDTIDATENYWGGPYDLGDGERLIKDMILDSDDDGSIGVRVLVVPWLDEPWPGVGPR